MTVRHALLYIAIAFSLFSCSGGSEDSRHTTLLPDSCRLQPGDLLFRRGTSLASHGVVLADREGPFSHVGIVVDSAGTMMVVHAVPGEPDYEGDPDRVKMETPAAFFTPPNAILGEVLRPVDSSAGLKAAAAALATYRRGTLFDHEYDSTDTTAVYCTQLVVEAYRKAGQEITGPPTHSYQFFGIKSTCWLPSDLYRSKQFTSIMTFKEDSKNSSNKQ